MRPSPGRTTAGRRGREGSAGRRREPPAPAPRRTCDGAMRRGSPPRPLPAASPRRARRPPANAPRHKPLDLLPPDRVETCDGGGELTPPQPVGHRRQGQPPRLGEAAGRRHEGAVGSDDRRQLGDEAALPDAGLAGHHDHPGPAAGGPAPAALPAQPSRQCGRRAPGRRCRGRSTPPVPARSAGGADAGGATGSFRSSRGSTSAVVAASGLTPSSRSSKAAQRWYALTAAARSPARACKPISTR